MTIDHDMEFETILEIVPYSGSDEAGIEEYDGAEEWYASICEYYTEQRRWRREQLKKKITKATNSYIHGHAYLSIRGLRSWLASFNWGKFFTREEYKRATNSFIIDYDYRFPNKNDLLQTIAEPLINQWLVIRKMMAQREEMTAHVLNIERKKGRNAQP
tara:strand:- start:825 stop:1301 length:477 start_codon:yes stop_codon:yes gene_type:complete